jgi:hypothetical protein
MKNHSSFTQIGYTAANIFNNTSRADVDYFHGATVTRSSLVGKMGGGGVTLGSYIAIDPSTGGINYDNTTLLHEYGHYLQARDWGGLPLLSLSLFSLGSAGVSWRSVGLHQGTWSEMDANARSLGYFKGRLDEKQLRNFTRYHPGQYYNGRFFRSYIFPGLLSYFLYDITWSD